MGLCGSLRCGCGISSSPSTEGAIDGYLPSINVSGSGEAGDPYNLTFNDDWAVAVVDSFTAVETDVAALETEVNTRGLIQYSRTQSDTATTTTVADVGVSVTFTADPSRMYRLTAFAQISSTVAADSIGLSITDAANTQVQRTTDVVSTAGRQTGLNSTLLLTTLTGSVTYKARYSRVSGTGNVQVHAAGNSPAWIAVEDMGPA